MTPLLPKSATGRALLLVGFCGLCAIYLIWTWSDEISEFGGDSAAYMIAARYFSPFWPASPVRTQFAQHLLYPPGFPLLIGWSGGSMLAGHLIVALCLIAAVACLFVWLRLEGIATRDAGWTALIFAAMPGTYLQSLAIHSENPFIALSLAAICAEHLAEPGPGMRRPGAWWLAALAVAAASMMRAAALPLVLAFLLRLTLRRPPRWPLLAVTSAGPFCFWALWSKLHQAGLSLYAMQLATTSNGNASGDVIDRIWNQASDIVNAWMKAWLAGSRLPFMYWLAFLFGCICLPRWLGRLRKLKFDAIYLAIYLLVLLVWPFPAEVSRLTYVIVPILLGYSVLQMRDATLALPLRTLKPSLIVTAGMAAMTITLLPSFLVKDSLKNPSSAR
jgi:hypothetical protein